MENKCNFSDFVEILYLTISVLWNVFLLALMAGVAILIIRINKMIRDLI